MPKSVYRKGQYVICRYDGKGNGDLIMGRIRSVRTNGDIILEDILSPVRKIRTKGHDILAKRNVVVPKFVIDYLLKEKASRKDIAAYAKGWIEGGKGQAQDIRVVVHIKVKNGVFVGQLTVNDGEPIALGPGLSVEEIFQNVGDTLRAVA